LNAKIHPFRVGNGKSMSFWRTARQDRDHTGAKRLLPALPQVDDLPIHHGDDVD